MIDFSLWSEMQHLKAQGLKPAQIAKQIGRDRRTVRRWLKRSKYQPRASTSTVSKLDPFKPRIVAWLREHPYSAQQVFQKLQNQGYEGGITILRDYVRQIRPPKKQAYLKLDFEPGECAQVDWGTFGQIPVGDTMRRLSFFVMVLAYSRMMYVHFTLAETMEHFLEAHCQAFEFIAGCPKKIWVDNCKVAILKHPVGSPAVPHPRYLELANHFGFGIVACGVRQPQQKGRVENGVGYVKKNFLAGHTFTDFAQVQPAAMEWLRNVANVRKHPQTGQRPIDLLEKEALSPLSPHPYDTGVIEDYRVSSTCRIRLDTNTYTVPYRLADQRVTLKRRPEELLIYHDNQLIATHVRSYRRRQDIVNEDHISPLLEQRRHARDQKMLVNFLKICSEAAQYYEALKQKRFQTTTHVRRILALAETHGNEPVARAIRDALHFKAYDSQYILNILHQRSRPQIEPGILHLTRREDLLEVDLPEPDLTTYYQDDLIEEPKNPS